MRAFLIKISIFLGLCSISLSIHSQQIYFSKKEYTQKTQFNIHFVDLDSEKRDLTFLIANQKLTLSQHRIPTLEKLQKLAQNQAIASAQQVATASKTITEAEYGKIYENIVTLTKEANAQISPWYHISLKRAGQVSFGVQSVPGRSASIDYFWKTPSLTINLSETQKSNDIIQALVLKTNADLPAGARVKVTFKGKNIAMVAEGNNNTNQLHANRALKGFQTQLNQLLQQRQELGTISTKHFQHIADILNKKLKELENIAKSQMDVFREQYRILYNQQVTKNYLTLVTYDRQDVMRVDYKKVVDDYVAAMKPVALALVRSLPESANIRHYVQTSLNFVQSIPYDTLEERNLQSLAGFLMPLDMVAQNRGDCDTKSAALLAIFANLLPTHKTIMIIIPNHAFIGINIQPKPEDMVYKYHDQVYVLMEVAGPAIFPVGQVGDRSRRGIAGRKILEVIAIS